MAKKIGIPEFKTLSFIGFSIPYLAISLLLFGALLYWWGTHWPTMLSQTLLWLIFIVPFIIPVVLLGLLWILWRIYVRAAYIATIEPILLEFKIPEHILKTPKAMEQVFMNLAIGPGESTFVARWINGKVRPWWSLELVSFEGEIHMYIWTFPQFRETIESIFYAQYPNIEIQEVPDYTSGIVFDKDKMKIFANEWALTKDDVYPITTYLDLDLDKEMRKAEQIVDPLSGVFEKMSTLGPGQQMWVQIVLRLNKGPRVRPIFWFQKPKKWTEEAEAEIEKIYEGAKPKKSESGEMENDGYPMLKPAEITKIKALERSMDKPAFDVGMRGLLIAEKDSFDGTKIAGFLSLFGSFNSGVLNGFKPGGPWHVSLDYDWEDRGGRTSAKYSAEALDAYRRRSYFHAPYNTAKHKRFVLTTEELATIFHFPSEEARAPGLRRVATSKSEPPVNLPT